jgi:ubiquinone/menaquinone biosynthesis C-methylase UbiE
VDYDAELQSHNASLFLACSIGGHENVLDVGCGTGQATREAARISTRGSALGVDISAPMIAQARELAAAEGLHNLRFEHGNAQVHCFTPRHYDVVISRYGMMFFDDPIDAFRNLHAALRPDGRVAMMVWQAHELNEWSVAVHNVIAAHNVFEPGAGEHFSFADQNKVEYILREAGFGDLNFTDVREPVYYGNNVDAAMEWVRGFRFVQDVLQRADASAATRLTERLREMLTKHSSASGVWFDAREWIITAKRR